MSHLSKIPTSDVAKEKAFEKSTRDDPFGPGLQRKLKNRHVAMITIGGVIGTGLFLGTAGPLRNGGPVGLVLGYIVMATICFAVMVSLGEMIAYLPIPGGHIKLAERFVNKSMSFSMGWNYWYNWIILLPAELSAAAILVSFWDRSINPAIWITIFYAVVIIINLFGAGAYGESEFIFSSIKVLTIVGLIILGVALDLGGGPNHDRIGFRYWKNPGPFVQYMGISGTKGRFLGWWAVMTQAAFSFVGTETVAVAAGEAKNPRRNIPKVIKRVYARIILFYVGGTIVIGLLVPSDDPGLNLTVKNAAASPFVIAISRSGIKVLPSIINACLLSSAWSAASSDLYISSRALYALALAGNAPKLFSRTTKKGLPLAAIVFSAIFGSLSYMAVGNSSGKVFGWFANMTAIAGMISWLAICFTYLRFYAGLKAQGIDRKSLPYYSPIQPFAAWYGLILPIIICFFSAFQVFLKGSWAIDVFITNYLPMILFPLMYLGSRRFLYKQPLVKSKEMDFYTGLAEVEAASYDDPPPRNPVERIWMWLSAMKAF